VKIPEFLRPRRFGLKVFIYVFPIVVVFSVFSIALGSRERLKQSFEAAADKTHGIAHMTSFALGPPLFFEDAPSIEEVVQSAKQNSDLAYLVVLDASGRAVAEFNRSAAPPLYSIIVGPDSHMGQFSPDGTMYHFMIPVTYRNQGVGKLLLGLSLRDVLQAAAVYNLKLIMVGMGLLVSGLAAVLFLSMAITKPLRRVSEVAREIARGDMSKRAPVTTLDESGQLAEDFNTMVDALAESRATLEDRVERRTQELQAEVAERRRVAAALRESEENFRGMVENLGEGVGMVSANETFLFANKTAADVFGVLEGGLVGRNLKEFLSPREYEVVRRQTGLRMKGEKSSYEIEILRPDGSPRSILIKATPRLGPGSEYLGALTVFADITGPKMAEGKLREANEKLHASVLALERRNAEAALLSELYEALQACREAKEIYETAGTHAVKLFPGEAGVLYIFKESRNFLAAVSVWGFGEPPEDVLVPDDCWALRTGKAHLGGGSAGGPVCPHVRSTEGAAPHICVPLSARGEILGLLHIRFHGGSGPSDERMDPAGLGVAQGFAERVALALDNFRLGQKLRQQSIRDPLTGLFNRRYLEETLARELARAERNGAPLGVIMLDIDKFKAFNDTYGHEAGDEMLKAIGAFFPVHVRKEDVVCRYGGEEFLIILPGASLEVSAERAWKLCEGIRPLRVAYGRISLGPISFSLGVAAFPRHGSTGMAVVQAADMAMLRAKKEGRNRVVVAE
jgi:diguanylate cyclase (GGDEF)-like protein/PAS domain S-box-containing protein